MIHLGLDILLVALSLHAAAQLNDSYRHARRKVDKRSMLAMAISALTYCFIGVYWIFNYHITSALNVTDLDAYLLTAFNYSVIGAYTLSAARFKVR